MKGKQNLRFVDPPEFKEIHELQYFGLVKYDFEAQIYFSFFLIPRFIIEKRDLQMIKF